MQCVPVAAAARASDIAAAALAAGGSPGAGGAGTALGTPLAVMVCTVWGEKMHHSNLTLV